MAYGTGAALEGTSLAFLENLLALGNDSIIRADAVLKTASAQMLQELQSDYRKIIASGGENNVRQAQQRLSRVYNTTQLLSKPAAKALTERTKKDIADARELGLDAGIELTKILEGTSKVISKNAQPNRAAIDAAGKRLEQFWDKENQTFRDRVTALTQLAAAKGWGFRKLSLQIRELLTIEQDQGTESDRSKRVNKRLGLAARAELIARTELQTAFVQGMIKKYRDLGYEWGRWSAAAERTCPYCIARDGLLFKLDDLEGAIPAHPRCRCTIIPAKAPPGYDKKGIDEVSASDSLDDLFWAKTREKKLSAWRDANRGIRDPKTDQILNDMLRRYLKTPTNTQRYLFPDAEAPKPIWMPSGSFLPDLAKAAQAQLEAAKLSRKDAASKTKEAEQTQKASEQEELDAIRKFLKELANADPDAFFELLSKNMPFAEQVLSAKEFQALPRAERSSLFFLASAPTGVRPTMVRRDFDGLSPKWKQKLADAVAKNSTSVIAKEMASYKKLVGGPKTTAQDARDFELVAANRPKGSKVTKADWDSLSSKTKAKLIKQSKEIQARKLSETLEIPLARASEILRSAAKYEAQGINAATAMARATGEVISKYQAAVKKRKPQEQRIADKVLTTADRDPGSAFTLKAKDFGDALKLLQSVNPVIATNIRRLMKFIERYNLATVTGTGYEPMGYFKDSRLISSYRTAKFRNKDILNPKQIFAEMTGLRPTMDLTERLVKVKQKSGVLGHTFEGGGSVAVKVTGLSQPLNRGTLQKILDAVEESVRLASARKKLSDPFSATTSSGIKDPLIKSKIEWLPTWIHELGHQVHYALGKYRVLGYPGDIYTPTKYGNYNNREWFAETFTQYMLSPKTLKRLRPDIYEVMDYAVRRVLTGTPGEAGYALRNGVDAPQRAGFPDYLQSKKQLPQQTNNKVLKETKALKSKNTSVLKEQYQRYLANLQEGYGITRPQAVEAYKIAIKKTGYKPGGNGYGKFFEALSAEAQRIVGKVPPAPKIVIDNGMEGAWKGLAPAQRTKLLDMLETNAAKAKRQKELEVIKAAKTETTEGIRNLYYDTLDWLESEYGITRTQARAAYTKAVKESGFRPGRPGNFFEVDLPRAAREAAELNRLKQLEATKSKQSESTRNLLISYDIDISELMRKYGLTRQQSVDVYRRAVDSSGYKRSIHKKGSPESDNFIAKRDEYASELSKKATTPKRSPNQLANSERVNKARQEYLEELQFVMLDSFTAKEAREILAKALKGSGYKLDGVEGPAQDKFYVLLGNYKRDAVANRELRPQANAQPVLVKGQTASERFALRKALVDDTAPLKRKDILSTFKMMEEVGGLTGANFRKLMNFAERYNISSIMAMDNPYGYPKGVYDMPWASQGWQGKQLQSSLRSANNRKDGFLDAPWRDAAISELTELRSPSSSGLPAEMIRAFFPTLAQIMPVPGAPGVSGATANGYGYTMIRLNKYSKPMDRQTFDKYRLAMNKQVRRGESSLFREPNLGPELPKFTHELTHETLTFKASDFLWLDTFIHEMGHQVHFMGGQPVYRGKDGYSPSKYGDTSPQEWFAETFLAYTVAPNALKKVSPTAYNFVETVLEAAFTGMPGRVNRMQQMDPAGKAIAEIYAPIFLRKIKTPAGIAPRQVTTAEITAAKKALGQNTSATLKAMASQLGMKGYTKLSKRDLIEAVFDYVYQAEQDDEQDGTKRQAKRQLFGLRVRLARFK